MDRSHPTLRDIESFEAAVSLGHPTACDTAYRLHNLLNEPYRPSIHRAYLHLALDSWLGACGCWELPREQTRLTRVAKHQRDDIVAWYLGGPLTRERFDVALDAIQFTVNVVEEGRHPDDGLAQLRDLAMRAGIDLDMASPGMALRQTHPTDCASERRRLTARTTDAVEGQHRAK